MRKLPILLSLAVIGGVAVFYNNCGMVNKNGSLSEVSSLTKLGGTSIGNPLITYKFSKIGYGMGTEFVGQEICNLANRCYPNWSVDKCLKDLQNVTGLDERLSTLKGPIKFSDLVKAESNDQILSDFEKAANIGLELQKLDCSNSVVKNMANENISGVVDLFSPVNYDGIFAYTPEKYYANDNFVYRTQWLRQDESNFSVRVYSGLVSLTVEPRGGRMKVSPNTTYAVYADIFPEAGVIPYFGAHLYDTITRTYVKDVGSKKDLVPNHQWTRVRLFIQTPSDVSNLVLTFKFDTVGMTTYQFRNVQVYDLQQQQINLVPNSDLKDNPFPYWISHP